MNESTLIRRRDCCPTLPGEHHQCEKRATRGTSNKAVTGNSTDRRARRRWLVSAWPADRVLIQVRQAMPGQAEDRESQGLTPIHEHPSYQLQHLQGWHRGHDETAEWQNYTLEVAPSEVTATLDWLRGPLAARQGVVQAYVTPCCRCYRCGTLLTEDTVSPDRIKPGAEGGTYARTNIRPACEPCQSSTGGTLGAARKAAKAKPRGKP